MPDTLLTRYNIKEHLRKFFWIYIVVIAAALVVANLLWLSTAPRVPGSQTVLVYLADSVSNPEALDDVAADMLARCQDVDETLRRVAFETVMFSRNTEDYTSMMVLMTRLTADEGDVWLACEPAMQALARSEAVMPLDDLVAAGWLAEYGLEPWYATLTDEETGESRTFCAGLKLDKLTALSRRMAIDSQGAYLALAARGDNPETTQRAVEIMVEDLAKESAGGDAE